LSYIYRADGRSSQAVKLLDDALKRRLRTLGERHMVTFQTMYALGTMYWSISKYAEAGGLLEMSVKGYERTMGEKDPTTIDAKNLLSLYKATAPESSGFRDSVMAVALSKQAVAAAPRVATYWNTLGIAQYRSGDWKQAVNSLEESLALGSRERSIDWLFLAMAHSKLGHRDKAYSYYRQAVDQAKTESTSTPEFLVESFRAEAEALIITSTPLPVAVFAP
jgi:tetratricopeptide (TPR) repeat protein